MAEQVGGVDHQYQFTTLAEETRAQLEGVTLEESDGEKAEEKKKEEKEQDDMTIFTSPFYIRFEKKNQFVTGTEHSHSQLRNLLQLSADEQYLFFVTSYEEEPPPVKEGEQRNIYWYRRKRMKISKFNRKTSEITDFYDMGDEYSIHAIAPGFGYFAVITGSTLYVMLEHNAELIFKEKLYSDTYPGSQLNGLQFRVTGQRVFLYVSRNGGYVNILEISYDRKENKHEVKPHSNVQVNKNVNSVSFGTGRYEGHLFAAVDYYQDHWFGKETSPGVFERIERDMTCQSSEQSSMLSSWCRNSEFVAIGTDSCNCIIYSFDAAKPVSTYKGNSPVRALAFAPSPDVPLLVFGDDNVGLHLVEIGSWKEKIVRVDNPGDVNGIKWSDDARSLFVAFGNKILEYKVTVCVPTLSELCISFIAANYDALKEKCALLPYEAQLKIKEEFTWEQSAKPAEPPKAEEQASTT